MSVIPVLFGIFMLLFFMFLFFHLVAARKQLKSLIQENPIRRISALEPGMVALYGRGYAVSEEELVRSPISDTPCLWYSVVTEELSGYGKHKSWGEVAEKRDGVKSVLRDQSGECLLDLSNHVGRYIPSTYRYGPTQGKGLLKRRYRASMPIKEDGRTRYLEYLIRPGAQLYVLGECVKGTSGSLEVVGSSQQFLIVTKRPFKVLLDDHAKGIWSMLILLLVFMILLYFINLNSA